MAVGCSARSVTIRMVADQGPVPIGIAPPPIKGMLMNRKYLASAVAVASLFALSACGHETPAADNVAAAADNMGDQLDANAAAISDMGDNMAANTEAVMDNKADALENKADAVRAAGENKADAMDAKTN
ncbi:MAG: hypothetical protein JWN66_2888 [Sphingomonas bacterium]|nr:hypothetical protein [Sphingomonas bacterium]